MRAISASLKPCPYSIVNSRDTVTRICFPYAVLLPWRCSFKRRCPACQQSSVSAGLGFEGEGLAFFFMVGPLPSASHPAALPPLAPLPECRRGFLPACAAVEVCISGG